MQKNTISVELIDAFQRGMEEIIPEDQANRLNIRYGSPERMAESAAKNLGTAAADGLFFRSGTAAFKHIVRRSGVSMGIDSLEFRLQPQKARLKDGVAKLVNCLQNWNAATFDVKSSNDDVEISTYSPGESAFTENQRLWLHFIAGLFFEFLYWAGGGKQYPFEIRPLETDGRLVICFQLQPVD